MIMACFERKGCVYHYKNVFERYRMVRCQVPVIGGDIVQSASSLRVRRSKGKGKGIRARVQARGRREEGNACKEAIVFAIPPTN